MNETTLLLLLSIPYFIDLMSGIFCFKFLLLLSDLDEERERPENANVKLYKLEWLENIIPRR